MESFSGSGPCQIARLAEECNIRTRSSVSPRSVSGTRNNTYSSDGGCRKPTTNALSAALERSAPELQVITSGQDAFLHCMTTSLEFVRMSLVLGLQMRRAHAPQSSMETEKAGKGGWRRESKVVVAIQSAKTTSPFSRRSSRVVFFVASSLSRPDHVSIEFSTSFPLFDGGSASYRAVMTSFRRSSKAASPNLTIESWAKRLEAADAEANRLSLSLAVVF